MIRLVLALVVTLLIGVLGSANADPWWAVWCLVGPPTCIYVAALALARHQGEKWSSW